MDRPDASVWRERMRVFLNKALVKSFVELCCCHWQRAVRRTTPSTNSQTIWHRVMELLEEAVIQTACETRLLFWYILFKNCNPPLSFPWCTLVGGVSAQRPFLTAEKWLLLSLFTLFAQFSLSTRPHPPSPLPSAPPVWVGCLVKGKKNSSSPSYERKSSSRTAIAVLRGPRWSYLWRQGIDPNPFRLTNHNDSVELISGNEQRWQAASAPLWFTDTHTAHAKLGGGLWGILSLKEHVSVRLQVFC